MSLLVHVESVCHDYLLEQYIFISQQSPASAERLLVQFEKTLEFLAKTPDIGSLVDPPRLRELGFRIRPILDFPNHLILYRAESERLLVLRLFHAASDYWAAFEESEK